MAPMKTAHQFKLAQDMSLSGEFKSPKFPNYGDFVRVLRGWKGKVCIDIKTHSKSFYVQVTKYDFIEQIRQNTRPESPCEFYLQLIDVSDQVLIFSRRFQLEEEKDDSRAVQ